MECPVSLSTCNPGYTHQLKVASEISLRKDSILNNSSWGKEV
jgi:hypothetical protein